MASPSRARSDADEPDPRVGKVLQGRYRITGAHRLRAAWAASTAANGWGWAGRWR